ncbi:hypothetical protein [Rahnella inusitata]|uniref:hypothetical protein n=1 Tax=Rahnella inusitata TaxID=58169 RepID=UPI0039B12707
MISHAFSNTRYRGNDGRVLPIPRVAQNPAAARFPLSVFEPQVSKPLRSAGFFDRAISPFLSFNLLVSFIFSEPVKLCRNEPVAAFKNHAVGRGGKPRVCLRGL